MKRDEIYSQKRSPQQIPRKAQQRLEEAWLLLDEGEYEEGSHLLFELANRFPASVEVLESLVELAIESDDWSLIARYSRQLLPYLRGEERAVALNNLLVAYARMDYVGLTYEAGRVLLEQHPEYRDIENIRALVGATEQFLKEQAPNILGGLELPEGERLEALVSHDRVRFYLESGQIKEAIRAGEQLMKQMPQLLAVRNNVSMAYFSSGNLERAVEVAEGVLELAPDNFNALANLVRYKFLTGRFDEAEAYAERLRQVRSDSPDLEAKQAEALAYLGDDEGVRSAYRRAKRRGATISPLFLHLAAVAHYRLGKEKMAWKLWQEAVEKQPLMGLARQSLDDRYAAAEEREVPWYWPIPYWMPAVVRNELEPLLGPDAKKVSDSRFRKKLRQMRTKYPYLEKLMPHILERGDGGARQLMFFLAQAWESPEVAEVLLEFAQGRYGSDIFRLEVIHYLSESYPQLMPPDRKVKMWAVGEQREVGLLNYEIYSEPVVPEDRPEALIEKDIRVVELLMERRAEEAEALLKEMIEAAPDFPGPYNQLAVAYEMQGRHEEVMRLGREILQRFPDYFFGRANMARLLAVEGDIDEATALIEPLLERQRMHIAEFQALAQAQMEILLAENNTAAARSWLHMWMEIVGDEEPNAGYWRRRIDGVDPDEIDGVLRSLLKGLE
jgi:tetratricopeptide (TPR) repeat protein